jgi:mannose-6-phosphate isomerase
MSKSALKRRAREARHWLMDACFPLWSERGVGDHGLFRESLTLDHQAGDQKTTRVRVQGRQTYVFTEALRMGWKPDTAADHIGMGLSTLAGPALRSDGLPGCVLNADGSGLADDTVDLYDIAFVLYALAESAIALDGAEEALAGAAGILKTVDAKMRAPDGGYFEHIPGIDQNRHQNPHMHFLEACLALHQADRDGGHLSRAGEIISLFDRFLTAGPGDLLGEHFAPGWTQPTGRDAEIVEPGHQFEWVWLLHTFAKASGTPVSPRAETLYVFACSTLDEEGRALLEVTREGAVADGSRRTWPQTESLKAHLAMFEATGEESFAAAACRSFDVLMDEHLTPEGGWIDRYDATGKPVAHMMPASTGYHVVLAMVELMRIMDA